jgi:hypothetical protein
MLRYILDDEGGVNHTAFTLAKDKTYIRDIPGSIAVEIK